MTPAPMSHNTIALAIRALKWRDMESFATDVSKMLLPEGVEPLPADVHSVSKQLSGWADSVLGTNPE